ncbi:MAG: hypothetical protein R3C41_21030 [Calditrichia bacterium]
MIEKIICSRQNFSQDVQNLDGTTVKLRGYMMPLDQVKRRVFILSANPVASCYFICPADRKQWWK